MIKKTYIAILLIVSLFFSCSEDNDMQRKQVALSLNFTHNWDATSIANEDFNELKFVNEKGDTLSIERLRYLVSKVTLINQNTDTIVLNDYNLVDVTNNENVLFTLSKKIPVGTYSNVQFTFGFDASDNIDGVYTDLNTASFDVPGMLNGGYHFMQFDGKFLNSEHVETGFNFHVISAFDTATSTATDTSFSVSLGEVEITNSLTLEVQADLSEWFSTPNTWDLNENYTDLMGNYEVQLDMSENGATVFSLGSVSQ